MIENEANNIKVQNEAHSVAETVSPKKAKITDSLLLYSEISTAWLPRPIFTTKGNLHDFCESMPFKIEQNRVKNKLTLIL